MNSLAWYLLAAFAEIGGCFAFWAWLRLAKSTAWIIPGMFSLALFAYALTKIDSSHAGRAYAAYGGVYIVSSLVWLWAVEKTRPDKWDILGALICIVGSLVILYGPRTRHETPPSQSMIHGVDQESSNPVNSRMRNR